MDKPKEALSNIKKLRTLLRGYAGGNTETTVKHELDLTESYLSIQKSRYGDRLDYAIAIDSALHSYVIPSLMLQPIVENSVVHCSEEKKTKTHILIYSRISKQEWSICVEDDGIGIDEAALQNLRKQLGENQIHIDSAAPWEMRHGIGLVNVNRRMKLYFGQAYGLHVQSRPGEGTLVEIKLPRDPERKG